MADTSLDKLVKLSSALPREDAENGLDHLAQQAYDDPKGTMILGVVVLDVHETKYRPTTDQEVAVVRIREIEAVPLDHALDLYERMKEMRVNRRGITQDELPEEDLPDHLDETVAIVPADEDAVVLNPFDPKKRQR